MAEHDRPPVGSVAEEASRLLDALGGWAGTASAAYAGSASHHDAPPADREPEPVDARSAHGGSRCESCGAQNGAGQAVACQLCPVCQGIALLRAVRPETVDRLADLAGAVAMTLRDLADQRRGSDSAGPAAPAGAATGGQAKSGGAKGSGAKGSGGHRVHDIHVDGDDEDEEPGVAP